MEILTKKDSSGRNTTTIKDIHDYLKLGEVKQSIEEFSKNLNSLETSLNSKIKDTNQSINSSRLSTKALEDKVEAVIEVFKKDYLTSKEGLDTLSKTIKDLDIKTKKLNTDIPNLIEKSKLSKTDINSFLIEELKELKKTTKAFNKLSEEFKICLQDLRDLKLKLSKYPDSKDIVVKGELLNILNSDNIEKSKNTKIGDIYFSKKKGLRVKTSQGWTSI
ncbi:MAG: hypothetical protein GY775_19305 [Candidatus Scalindua sp.]|nr:hypothetical protein [Candidatus Scalindua sp.]